MSGSGRWFMEDASVEELEGEKTTKISPQISQAPYVRLVFIL